MVTQGTWGNDPWEKLERSALAAHRLGADSVVVHPPFRWQRSYAQGFVEGIRRLERTTGIIFAVENMFPWRGPRGTEVRAYSPGWDPTERDYDHLTLDLSHASTSQQKSLDLVDAWGERLTHVHLTDGDGSIADSHLFPGEGDQEARRVLSTLASRGFAGHVVLELNTRSIGSRSAREEALARALAWTREALSRRWSRCLGGPPALTEVLLVLGVSLGQSAVYSLLSIVEKMTRDVPLNQQTTSINNSVTPDRSWLDLAYQLAGMTFPLVPMLLALYLLRLTGDRAGIGFDLRRPGFDLARGFGAAALIGIPGLAFYFAARQLGINTNVAPANLAAHWWTIPVLVGTR